MNKQIIVCHEKHGEAYYDASTPELWAKSSLAILTERFNQGYWYHDPRQEKHPFSLNRAMAANYMKAHVSLRESVLQIKRREERDDLLLITDEQINAIPSDAARVDLRRNRQRARQDKQRELEQVEEYDRIKAVVEAKDGGFVTLGRGHFERQVPRAWMLLDDRSDHEYEQVSLEQLQ